jgi:hypothetical protein
MPILQREQYFSRPNSYHQNFRIFGVSGHLTSFCNAKVMLIFTNQLVTKLATGAPQKPMDWVRKAQIDAGQRAGVTRSAQSCAGRATR